ncbi:hypothetical protein MMC30_000649 [Trapelia coarctata]|nr:hypothetical protein [Trapelia coarctata]
MAGQIPVDGAQEWFHTQMEPSRLSQAEPIPKQASFESMKAEDDQEEGWRTKEFVQGSQVVQLSPDGKPLPLVRIVVDDPENSKSDDNDDDDDFEFLYGRQTPSTDGSVSPLLLTDGPLTHEHVGSELSSSDAVTIRQYSKADAGESIDTVLHAPSRPLPARLGGIPRMPSQTLMTMEPDKRDAFLDWKLEKAEKSLLPTPLRIPEKAVTKGSRGPARAPNNGSVIKGKKRERTSDEDQSWVDEKKLAMLNGSEGISVIVRGGPEESKRSISGCDSLSANSIVSYQQRPLPQTPTSMLGSGKKIPKVHASLSSNADSMASRKYNASVSSSSSSMGKPLPPIPPLQLAQALELLRKQNSRSSGMRVMHRASPNQEQFCTVKDSLRSPRRSISPIQEGDDLAHSPAPPTELDSEAESHIHPLERKQALASQRVAEQEGMTSMFQLSRHRRQLSDGSSSEIVSPADMKSPFTRSSNTPSTYLHSPPSSPIQPELGYESDSLSELPLFRSARASPLNLIMNYKRASLEARASLEMTGPEAPYIRRNFRPERRRSREAMKEYAQAIEAINGLERLRDIDDEIKDALVLGKHELINLGDIPNPNLSKVSLSPVANRSWPMKKKSSLLRKISTVDLGSETRATRESSSTVSSGSLLQQSPVGIRSLSGSSANTTDPGALPIFTPTSSVAPEHAVALKDIANKTYELQVMEAPKKDTEAVVNVPKEDRPKTPHGHSFLKSWKKGAD